MCIDIAEPDARLLHNPYYNRHFLTFDLSYPFMYASEVQKHLQINCSIVILLIFPSYLISFCLHTII